MISLQTSVRYGVPILLLGGSAACAVLWYLTHKPNKPKDVRIEDYFQYPQGLELQDLDPPPIDLDFSRYAIFSQGDPDGEGLEEWVRGGEWRNECKSRAVACFMGNLLGDALGAPFEFSAVRYGIKEMRRGFEEAQLWEYSNYNTFKLKPGQWTDDGSMTLCLADSLIQFPDFNPYDVRMRFLNWKQHGYCNAFGFDDRRFSKASVGLGGNVSDSLREFVVKRTDYTTAGDRNTSGNGSVMRNSPVCVCYWTDRNKAMQVAVKQSRTTHQGHEAYACCSLLTYICVTAIGLGKDASLQSVLSDLSEFCELDAGECKSVHGIALSKDEGDNRNWNWRCDKYYYAPERVKSNPGYIGSYAMDALAMALHCVWTTSSFEEALLKSANLRGDSDSVSAVTGQIAGAIYGYQAIPPKWIEAILKWDPNYIIPLRANKMYKISLKLKN